MNTPPVALTIAGSDSGGGAGIQADLKTFAALGCYGTSVVTAITAQNTIEVKAVENVSTRLVEQQLEAVVTDIPPLAAKTGMLGSSKLVKNVAKNIGRYKVPNLVVDPVMVATSGQRLVDDGVASTLLDTLVPCAVVVTPNVYEAEIMCGLVIKTVDDMYRAAELLYTSTKVPFVVKGGHLETAKLCHDVLVADGLQVEFSSKRYSTTSTHGTGCTFAAAIAANLAHGKTLTNAVEKAHQYLNKAIDEAFEVGYGNGPVNHFYEER